MFEPSHYVVGAFDALFPRYQAGFETYLHRYIRGL